MNTEKNCNILDVVSRVLIRCFWGGVIFLLIWIVFFITLGDGIYSVHSRWFTISRQQFDMINYSGIALIKGFVFLVFLLPYICIRIVVEKND